MKAKGEWGEIFKMLKGKAKNHQKFFREKESFQVALVIKNPPANAGDCGFDTWVVEMHWRRKWLPTPVFLPGECHG